MQGNESTLNSEVTSIVGLPGYKNALNHYNNSCASFKLVNKNCDRRRRRARPDTPRVSREHEDLRRPESPNSRREHCLAYAAYDASIIGLATGGYTGS